MADIALTTEAIQFNTRRLDVRIERLEKDLSARETESKFWTSIREQLHSRNKNIPLTISFKIKLLDIQIESIKAELRDLIIARDDLRVE